MRWRVCLQISDLQHELSAVGLDDGVFDTVGRGKDTWLRATCIYTPEGMMGIQARRMFTWNGEFEVFGLLFCSWHMILAGRSVGFLS